MIQRLPSEPAIHLAHAFLSQIAARLSVDILFFKGATAIAQGLRSPRASADVDLLVRPNQVSAFTRELTQRGWRARYLTPEDLRGFPNNSVTLVHPEWPCDIDIHSFFVGTFADPSETFDLFWRDRVSLQIAGTEITAPSNQAHRLLLAINVVRDSGLARAEQDGEALSSFYRTDDEAWNGALELASLTRSLSVMREFAARYDLPLPEEDLTVAERMQLEQILKYRGRGMGHLKYTLRRKELSLTLKARAISYYLYKPRQVLTYENPSFTGGAFAAFKANCRRWQSGYRQWAAARRVGLVEQNAADVPGGREGSLRAIDVDISTLPFAELVQTENGVSMKGDRKRPAAAEPLTKQSDLSGRLEVLCYAQASDAANLYVMSLDEERLDQFQDITPPVLCLNEGGKELLELLKNQPGTAAEVVERVSSTYQLDSDVISLGITGSLNQLYQAGLVRATVSRRNDSGY